jgi:nicotinamide-nucleotide amidase
MKAHIITIGDELLIGQTLNTNVAFIGEKLTLLQIKIKSTSVVSDDEEEIIREFKRTLASNDLVLVTGGLGPTHDDITRNCVVEYFDTELVEDPEVLSDVKAFFDARGKPLTEINRSQALIPKIAIPIRNMVGTAPGIWIEKGKKHLICMPGVPHEMINMMENYVLPKLEERIVNKGFTVIRNLLTTGIGESILFERFGNIEALLQGAKLAFLPSAYGVKMRLTVEAPSEEEAINRIDEIEQKIRAVAGRYIFGTEADTLESVVAKILIERGLKIGVAESCTGGLISHRLTNIGGSSQFLDIGIIAYSNDFKMKILNVKDELIQKYGAVSLEVARQMADGVRLLSGANIGLSVTGIMGPTGATPSKPLGLVYISISDESVCKAKMFRFGDSRLLNKERTSQAALEMLRRHLLGIADAD